MPPPFLFPHETKGRPTLRGVRQVWDSMERNPSATDAKFTAIQREVENVPHFPLPVLATFNLYCFQKQVLSKMPLCLHVTVLEIRSLIVKGVRKRIFASPLSNHGKCPRLRHLLIR